MPRAASTIVEALGRYPRSRGEDQLTELFALSLQTVPELSRWFINEALEAQPDVPGPPDGMGPAVFTQTSALDVGRPDMILDYRDPDRRWRRILSEHKIDADFTELQRAAYAGSQDL